MWSSRKCLSLRVFRFFKLAGSISRCIRSTVECFRRWSGLQSSCFRTFKVNSSWSGRQNFWINCVLPDWCTCDHDHVACELPICRGSHVSLVIPSVWSSIRVRWVISFSSKIMTLCLRCCCFPAGLISFIQQQTSSCLLVRAIKLNSELKERSHSFVCAPWGMQE